MSSYFTIGEISKLYNLSIQTLRHYDKIGLLSPAYTNPDTGYRYYSIQQFVKIDFIKHGKALGMALDEIKELVQGDLSIPVLTKLFREQRHQIESKIVELTEINDHIQFLQSKLEEISHIGWHQPTLKMKPPRSYIRYDCICRNELELEINIRQVILDMEEHYGRLNSELVFVSSPLLIHQEQRIQYDGILVHLINPKNLSNTWVIETLPEGTYLTLYYDDHYQHNLHYYQLLLQYLKDHHLVPLSPIYEFTILPRVDQEGIEKSIVCLEVLVEPKKN